jgi:hypothetical protein
MKSDVIFADLGVGTVIMATIAYFDHLFGDIGNGIIIEGPAADYFDSGESFDTVPDFNLAQADVVDTLRIFQNSFLIEASYIDF